MARILHLVDRWGGRGGSHQHLAGVLDELAAAGHQLHVAAGADVAIGAPPGGLSLVPALAARLRQPAELDALVRGFEPDVVHVHTVVNPAVLEWAAGQPAVVTVQDHRYFCPGRGKWTAAGEVCAVGMGPEACARCFDEPTYFEEIYGVTAERLAALTRLPVVVLSAYMRRELVAAGVAEDRVTVVPPFVHGLDREATAAGQPCVGFVGRLTPAKGVLEAAEAWRAAGVGLPLVFAGSGTLRGRLEREGFEVLGWLDRAQLSAFYRRARAVMMPSRWQEPFGIVGLEALTMGTPVVAWESGGVREWHPGPGLVPWGDVAGLAVGLAASLGSCAEAPRGFEPKALTRRLLGVYSQAAGRHLH